VFDGYSCVNPGSGLLQSFSCGNRLLPRLGFKFRNYHGIEDGWQFLNLPGFRNVSGIINCRINVREAYRVNYFHRDFHGFPGTHETLIDHVYMAAMDVFVIAFGCHQEQGWFTSDISNADLDVCQY
jgi:hypothetical protein